MKKFKDEVYVHLSSDEYLYEDLKKMKIPYKEKNKMRVKLKCP